MPLRFPNARLHMHNLLADNVPEADAIAMTAMEYGLVDHEFLSEFTSNVSESHLCCCLQAAQSVLKEYFNSNSAPVDFSQVWTTLVEEAKSYLASKTPGTYGSAEESCQHMETCNAHSNHNKTDYVGSNTSGSATDEENGSGRTLNRRSERCPKSPSTIESGLELCNYFSGPCRGAIGINHDCAKFAPVLFDLMLQQIRRYS